MSLFSDSIRQLLNQYKAIIKKSSTRQSAKEQIMQLSLKRKHLSVASDIELYQKAKKVIAAIDDQLKNNSNAPSWHSGLDEFHQHLKDVLNEYMTKGRHIIHRCQKVSSSLIEAVQLVSLPNTSLNETIAEKLNRYSQDIANFGSKAQKEMFIKALKSGETRNTNFFLPILDQFEKHNKETRLENTEEATV